MRRGKKVLKKLTVMYIQKGLTLGYTAQTLNLFKSHSFFDVGLAYYFFVRIRSILTHTEGRRRQLLLVVYTYGTRINYDSCIHLKFIVIYTSRSLYQLHLEAFSFNTSRIMDSIMLGSQQKNYYSFTTFQIILPLVHHNLKFKKILKTHM